MPKYHISPDSGRANICRASIKDCPIGDANEHFETKEEARAAYENRMTADTFTPVSKKVTNIASKRAEREFNSEKLETAWKDAPKYPFNKADIKMVEDLVAGKKITDEKLDDFLHRAQSETIADPYVTEDQAAKMGKVYDEVKKARDMNNTASTLNTIEDFDPATQTLFSNAKARSSATVAGRAIRREFAHTEWMYELAASNRATARSLKAEGANEDAALYENLAAKEHAKALESEARVAAQLREVQYLHDTDTSFQASSDIRRMLMKGWFRPKASNFDGIYIGSVKKVK